MAHSTDQGDTPRSVEDPTIVAVRVALAKAGRTQADLARALGMPTSSLSRRMKGAKAFEITELRKAAGYLGVHITQLVELPEITPAALAGQGGTDTGRAA